MLSNAKKVTAATAATGAAMLAFGLTGPAFANGSAPVKAMKSTATEHAKQHRATVAEVQAQITERIGRRLARILKAEALVTASTVLTAQQKTDLTTKLAAKATLLLTLKSAVAAATTEADLRAAVKAYVAAGGKLLWADRDELRDLMAGQAGHRGADRTKAVTSGSNANGSKGHGPKGHGAKGQDVANVPAHVRDPGSASAQAHRVEVRTASNGRKLTVQWNGVHANH